MKFLLVIGGGVIVLLASVFAYLTIGFAEPDDLRLSNLTTRLFVPSEVRDLPLDETCGVPATVSREWLECGGICGVSYFVSARVSGNEESIQQRLNDYQSRALQKYKFVVDIGAPDMPSGCRILNLDISHDNRQ